MWIIRDSSILKMMEFERFLSLDRRNLPNVTSGTKKDVRRRNSFIAY